MNSIEIKTPNILIIIIIELEILKFFFDALDQFFWWSHFQAWALGGWLPLGELKDHFV